MALFGKKKEEEMAETAPADAGSPVDLIIQMRQQGYNDDQIVQSLQRDGYDSNSIFDAMNQADVKGGVEAVPEGGLEPAPGVEEPMQMPLPGAPGSDIPPMGSPSGGSFGSEEMVEKIVEEKWDDMSKEFVKSKEWRDKTENRISRIEDNFKNLKEEFDKLHQALIGKIGEYDKNILSVGTEIKAMEKVFQKILPTFTENVSELSRITRSAGKKSAKKK